MKETEEFEAWYREQIKRIISPDYMGIRDDRERRAAQKAAIDRLCFICAGIDPDTLERIDRDY